MLGWMDNPADGRSASARTATRRMVTTVEPAICHHPGLKIGLAIITLYDNYVPYQVYTVLYIQYAIYSMLWNRNIEIELPWYKKKGVFLLKSTSIEK